MALNNNQIKKIQNEFKKNCKFLEERDLLIAEFLKKMEEYSVTRLSPLEKEFWEKYPQLVITQQNFYMTEDCMKLKWKRSLNWYETDELKFRNLDYPILFFSGGNLNLTNKNLHSWENFVKTDNAFSKYIVETCEKIINHHTDYLDFCKDLDSVINSRTSITFLKNSFPEAYKIYKS